MCFHKFTAYYISNFVNCLYPLPSYHLLNDFLIRGLQKLYFFYFFKPVNCLMGICYWHFFPHSFPGILCWFWVINEVKFLHFYVVKLLMFSYLLPFLY